MLFWMVEAQAQGQPGGESGFFSIVMLVVFIAIFYFFLIRPQAKRTKEHRTMVSSLQKGDEVITSGGMLGKISDLGDNYIVLEISENVLVKIQRSAIGSLVPKGTIKSTT